MKKKIIVILFTIIAIIILNLLNLKNVQAVDTEETFFSEDITWSWEYFEASGEVMPYGLCTPSNASEFEALPVIVWLHGSPGAEGANGSRYT